MSLVDVMCADLGERAGVGKRAVAIGVIDCLRSASSLRCRLEAYRSVKSDHEDTITSHGIDNAKNIRKPPFIFDGIFWKNWSSFR